MRVLIARDIHALSKSGIIIRDQFRPSHCEGVTYNLTLGHRIQSITATESGYREIDGPLILKPREAVNVEINEKFNFCDVEGRPRYFGVIVAGARLLAGGISHPATVIDPGFRHTTTLTLVNLRNFPSRAFRPGSDYIAKLLVFELTEDQVPEAWTETAAYRQSGPDSVPSYWADFHLMPVWSPTTSANPDDLHEAARAFGPPFDLFASLILEQRQLFTDASGSLRPIRDFDLTMTSRLDRLEQSILLLTERMVITERTQTALSETSKETMADVSGLERRMRLEWEQGRRDRVERRRFWLTVLVAFVSAIVGATVGAVLPSLLKP